jgi:hypothetical protein
MCEVGNVGIVDLCSEKFCQAEGDNGEHGQGM